MSECSWEVIEEECARDLGLFWGTIKVNLLYFKFSIIEEQFHSVDVGKRPNHVNSCVFLFAYFLWILSLLILGQFPQQTGIRASGSVNSRFNKDVESY